MNPIERVERSALIMASTIHQQPVKELVNESSSSTGCTAESEHTENFFCFARVPRCSTTQRSLATDVPRRWTLSEFPQQFTLAIPDQLSSDGNPVPALRCKRRVAPDISECTDCKKTRPCCSPKQLIRILRLKPNSC